MPITQVSLDEMMKTSPGLDKQSVTELKAWYSQQSHLPKLSDAELALFYLKNTYDMEETKKNITNYFIMRSLMPEFFVDTKALKSDELKTVYETVFISTLPERTKDNHKVIMARLMDTDPKKYNLVDALKVMNMVMDDGVYNDGPDNRYIFVFDINGATMEHSNSVSYMNLKKFYDYLRKGSPVRWIGSHYIDSASKKSEMQDFVESKIVNGKIVENSMIKFHQTVEELLEATGMSRSMLPKEMDGEAGPMKDLQSKQVKRLESMYQYYSAMDTIMGKVAKENLPSEKDVFGPPITF